MSNSRSSELTRIDRVPILYRFQDMARYLSKMANVSERTSIQRHPRWVYPVALCNGNWAPKKLEWRDNKTCWCLQPFRYNTRVWQTDRQTDSRRRLVSRLCIALRGKKMVEIVHIIIDRRNSHRIQSCWQESSAIWLVIYQSCTFHGRLVASEWCWRVQVEQLRHAEQGLGLFEDHMAFVRSLAFDLNVDETTLILLLVIALFSPDRDRLNDRELIAAQQERYTWHVGGGWHLACYRVFTLADISRW